MIAAIRARLNDLERRHPLAYAVGLVLACDAGIIAAVFTAGAFA